METISPELALVDAELDEAARQRLRSVPEWPEGRAPERPRARSWPQPIVIAGVVAVLLLILTPGSVVGGGAPGRVADMRGERATAPAGVLVRWKRVPGAGFYNMIVWRDGVRVLDLWPHKAAVRVPREKLEPGTYLWFVYPSFKTEDGRRFGELAKSGKFSVRAGP
jgi:hypothetical protein